MIEVGDASMRPARFAREINRVRKGENMSHNSFNEARAFCAGNWPHGRPGVLRRKASMRPARFAREIRLRRGWPCTDAQLQ